MTTIFIAGSRSIHRLHQKVQARISNIVSSDFNVVVGDAGGADTAIQKCLHAFQANKVAVYCSGKQSRHNVGNWPVYHVQSEERSGSRAFFTAKDIEMAKISDFGLMVWDGQSIGTLSNVIELLKMNKKSVVFIHEQAQFWTVGQKSDLDHLLHFISDHARAKVVKITKSMPC